MFYRVAGWLAAAVVGGQNALGQKKTSRRFFPFFLRTHDFYNGRAEEV